MQPRICVPVMERNVKRAARVLRQLESRNPDLVEIRFDRMKTTSSLSEIRDATDRPLIATNRRADEGGYYSGAESKRLAILVQAARSSFDYVDLELRTRDINQLARQLKQEGTKVIVSYHGQKLTSSQCALESILAREKRVGADICKIVGKAERYSDNLSFLTFVSKHAKRIKLVCFLMGRLGIPSRVLSPILGAYFTFASAGSDRETAVGQIPIDRLRGLYKELGVS